MPVTPRVPIQTPMFDAQGLLTRTWIIFFERLGSGFWAPQQAGGSPGPFIRTFLVRDTTVGDNVGDNVYAFGAAVNQSSTIRRIGAVLRTAISSDLTVRFHVIYPDGTDRVIGDFTIPSSTPLQETITWSTFENETLPDRSVLVPDITESDGSVEVNGVAEYTIEWIGRSSGQTPVEGVAWQGEWVAEANYAKDDVVHYNGSTYISLQDDNMGHQPDTEGDWWALVAAEGTEGAPAPLIVGFVINNGAAGITVGPILRAPRDGSFTKCVVAVKASDSGTALTFMIKQNGAGVFTATPTIAAGTPGGLVTTFTLFTSSPLPVAAEDLFTIDIVTGGAAWQFTAQLE